MSGSAALSAAKRRRAVNVNEQPSSQPRQNTTTETGNPQKLRQLNPLQVLNQHHMKLDILYQRQDKINKMLNITDEENDDNVESDDNIVTRIEKIERNMGNSNEPIRDENELLNQINEFKKQIDEMRSIILNVQSHSISVSLDLIKLKKDINNEVEQDQEVNEEEVNEQEVNEQEVNEQDITED